MAVDLARMNQRLDILGETRAAVPRPREEELVPDAGIGADADAHTLDVGADPFGQVGQVVHEADLRGQQGIRCVLGQLAGAHVHELHAVVRPIEGRVELVQGLARQVALGRLRRADDDAVRLEEVVDRVALLEELGVRADHEGLLGVAADDLPDAVRGAHGHGALGEHDLQSVDEDVLAAGQGLADGVGHRVDEAHLRRAVVPLGGAHGDEDDGPVAHGLLHLGGEAQTLLLDVALDDVLEPRLEEGHLALPELLDLSLVHVGADDLVARVRQTSAHDQTHVPAANDCDSHCQSSLCLGLPQPVRSQGGPPLSG